MHGTGQSADGRYEVEVASFHFPLLFTTPPQQRRDLTTTNIATMRAACLPSTMVTVTVNGRALRELQQTDIVSGDQKGATAFIESVDGADFAVEMDLEAGLAHYDGSIQLTIYLDGVFMGGSVVDLRNGKHNTKVSGVYENSINGRGSRRFTFARHEMSMLKC